MTDTPHPLVGRYLTQSQLYTAAGTQPAQVLSDLFQQYCLLQPQDDLMLQKGTLAVVPAMAYVDEPTPREWPFRWSQFQMAFRQHNQIPLDNRCAVFLTLPEPADDASLRFLPIQEAGALVQCHSEASTTAAMAQLQYERPELSRWVWLAADSRCTLPWLRQQTTLFSEAFPNGPAAGEAMVVTEWDTVSKPNAAQLTAWALHEVPKGHSPSKVAAIRTQVLRQAGVTEALPPWASIIGNDDFSKDQATEHYQTEVTLWPQYQADPLWGDRAPLISWAPVLGDLGLASVPFGLVMAAQRLRHPLHPLQQSHCLINSENARMVGRMEQVSSEPSSA